MTKRNATVALAVGAAMTALSAGACFAGFGKPDTERSYFVLHTKPRLDFGERPIKGLVRVRTLHADAVYEKFQVAVRKNPYELRYDENHIWIAKPKRMISDLIAQSLKESKRFSGVTRELGEVRPDYNLSGNLHAIEVFDSGDTWYAHLSMSLQLTRYDTGEALYFMEFDQRRQLGQRSFSLAARALSELLATALERMMKELDEVKKLTAPAGAGEQDEAARAGRHSRTPASQGAATGDAAEQAEQRAEELAAEDDELPPGEATAPDEDAARQPGAAEDEVILVPERP